MTPFNINLDSKIKILEAHSGLSALLINNYSKNNRHNNGFDGIWVSSLTETASKGIPDNEIIGFESRVHLVAEMRHVSELPIIVDMDTGGTPEQLAYRIEALSRLNVAAIVIEDKVFPKKNSFSDAHQQLEDTAVFCRKIELAKSLQTNGSPLVVARLEGLILGLPLENVLQRALQFTKAGADAILIHSKQKKPDEVLEFALQFKKICISTPLVCIPTTYNCIADTELFEAGFNLIIHANHLLRASMFAMDNAIKTIARNGSSFALEPLISPISDVIKITETKKSRP